MNSSLWADWPQWRGPDRNGVSKDGILPASFDDDFAPKQLWQSEEIPSDHDGGHGSPIIAGGKVYLSVVWHHDVPTAERHLSSRVVSDLGWRTGGLPKELLQELEEQRESLSPRLRGKALDEFVNDWTADRLSPKEEMTMGSWVRSRLKKGSAAIPMADFEIMKTVEKQPFADADQFQAWVSQQAWSGEQTADEVLRVTPTTKKEANDVVICLDLSTGETLWKFSTIGSPNGRTASSTPSVVDGVCVALLSRGVYAMDPETGEEQWRWEFDTKKGVACSPAVGDGVVMVNVGELVALEARSGRELWRSAALKSAHSSPVIWKDMVLWQGAKEFVGLSLGDGSVRWRHKGGGDASPVISGDTCVLVSKSEDHSLSGFRLSPEGARRIWEYGFLSRRYGSSPLIHEGHLYHLGSARHLCLDLSSGEVKWEVDRVSNLSSPILVGDRILSFENNGGYVSVIRATPEGHEIEGRTRIGALGSSSASMDESLYVVRQKDRVVCFDWSQRAGQDG